MQSSDSSIDCELSSGCHESSIRAGVKYKIIEINNVIQQMSCNVSVPASVIKTIKAVFDQKPKNGGNPAAEANATKITKKNLRLFLNFAKICKPVSL